MDKITKKYRINQFKHVLITPASCDYSPKIKIITPIGETKWLDITQEEMFNIKEILTTSI